MIFCAEIGSNHKGIKSLAYEMIRQSKLAGADIAKFQLGHAPNDPIRYIDPWAGQLQEWCSRFRIQFMASVFSEAGLNVARSIRMIRYKIAYGIYNKDLIQAIYDQSLLEVFHSGVNIWCKSEYPCYDISDMPKKFGDEWLGYSSHTHGIEDALIAIARGAQYIEKHVTLDKTEESIKDNHFALSFDEFAEMVRLGRGIERILNG